MNNNIKKLTFDRFFFFFFFFFLIIFLVFIIVIVIVVITISLQWLACLLGTTR